MAINMRQNYTFFTGEGIEFYQWHRNGPNGAFVSNWELKDSSSRAIPVPNSEMEEDGFLLFLVV